MKGLILSGGKGTRLYPLTYTSAKQLIPIANKPVLFRVIESVCEAGITDIGIVVGDSEPEIRKAVEDGSRWGVHITYIRQSSPAGLAHAVKESVDFLGDERFVMFLGDNIIQGGISSMVREFADNNWSCQILLKRVPDPQHFGIVQLDGNLRIKRLEEKPKRPPADPLALVGIYMFDRNIFEAVNSIKPSERGEYEITDAIRWMADQGYEVHPYIHEGWWIDTGKPGDLISANSYLLDELEPRVEGHVHHSRVDGRVAVERGAEIVDSTIEGPAIIGENTRIVDSYIGPYTSIYHDVEVENSEISRSIILEYSQIKSIPARIHESVIGRNVKVSRSTLKPRAYKMNLGDFSDVGILNGL